LSYASVYFGKALNLYFYSSLKIMSRFFFRFPFLTLSCLMLHLPLQETLDFLESIFLYLPHPFT